MVLQNQLGIAKEYSTTGEFCSNSLYLPHSSDIRNGREGEARLLRDSGSHCLPSDTRFLSFIVLSATKGPGDDGVMAFNIQIC